MRCLLVLLVACSATAPAKPAPVISNATRSCIEAATGLERATKGLRAPDQSVLEAMRKRCEMDAWPAEARECFTTMNEGDLGRCAKLLPDAVRDGVLEILGSTGPRTKIAVARARLEQLQVGVAECDRFVATVTLVLGCEAMPVETRADLGSETAEFWSLPTHGLSADAQHRMATACGASLASLQQQAASVGCMP